MTDDLPNYTYFCGRLETLIAFLPMRLVREGLADRNHAAEIGSYVASEMDRLREESIEYNKSFKGTLPQ
jgi:hypothetical protein